MSDYDTDILTWSERQATLLRRRAAGELVNDAEIDWPNVAEEIESVGTQRTPGASQSNGETAATPAEMAIPARTPQPQLAHDDRDATSRDRGPAADNQDSASSQLCPTCWRPRIAQPATMPSPKPDCSICRRARHSRSSRRSAIH